MSVVHLLLLLKPYSRFYKNQICGIYQLWRRSRSTCTLGPVSKVAIEAVSKIFAAEHQISALTALTPVRHVLQCVLSWRRSKNIIDTWVDYAVYLMGEDSLALNGQSIDAK